MKKFFLSVVALLILAGCDKITVTKPEEKYVIQFAVNGTGSVLIQDAHLNYGYEVTNQTVSLPWTSGPVTTAATVETPDENTVGRTWAFAVCNTGSPSPQMLVINTGVTVVNQTVSGCQTETGNVQ